MNWVNFMEFSKMKEGAALLFRAIMDNDIKSLERQLQRTDVDINTRAGGGETPLTLSLRLQHSSNFIMRLIRAGSDVNVFTRDEMTPLHLAVYKNMPDIVHVLIKRGANINAGMLPIVMSQGMGMLNWRGTPLHSAIEINNYEIVCILLYYEADVYARDANNRTPLNYAVHYNFFEVAEMLLDHYEDSYYACCAAELGVQHEGTALLLDLFKCANSSELSKLIWIKSNSGAALNDADFYQLFMELALCSYFPEHAWLEWINLMSESFIERQGEKCNTFEFTKSFFERLFKVIYSKNLQQADRLVVVFTYLSLGAPVSLEDFNGAYHLYGFGKEFEALVYGDNGDNDITETSALSLFIAPTRTDLSTKLFNDLFEFISEAYKLRATEISLLRERLSCCVAFLGFFSLPREAKQWLRILCRDLAQSCKMVIFEKLDSIPEFPSLQEISRNQTRLYLLQTRKIKYVYQFYDAVKMLKLPEVIKDELLLKRPMYHSLK